MERTTRKKKLGGYPAVGVVISMTLALFVISLFGLLVIYSQELETQVRLNIRIQVFLKPSITENQRLQIENTLRSQDYVSTADEESITFVSKEEAADEFIKATGEDFKKFLGDNPLRDAYLVTIDPKMHTIPELEKIKADIQKMNGVFQVEYVENLIESVNKNFTNIGLFLLGVILILLITVILLINNTLRIALFSQRFLIRSMQLVGATKWFIQGPFLLRATGYGLLAGVISGVFLMVLTNYAEQRISDLALLHNQSKLLGLIAVSTFIGIVIAFASTYLCIRRYLKMSLDDLY
jgi:cell division transport system permease protein